MIIDEKGKAHLGEELETDEETAHRLDDENEEMKKKYDNESVEFGFKCGYEKREAEIIEMIKDYPLHHCSKKQLIEQIKEQNGSAEK